ncbi:helicase-related protein [Palleronia caenipelagi]|uniref:Disulfide oxidoreductase n=1 Tax=Palleronia caenipelagi TaxID=2489174 RepID=A0A547Q366_9RHOB|nr:helicase-related protein [Palleronia caenipelagi]TRD20819.1 disulfide oxidoreductase [Palleronia caenipelagi]
MGRITAVLGPTNTGKTHYALERMLGYRSGIIGLPLRLLAREVYDKLVAIRGPSVVALVTGEERIVPERTQYWVCTVEAMPEAMGTDFLAIDEIQLCADPERGHVFTDRLLRARGTHETLFLGADTVRSAIAELVPQAQFMRRDRFSTLTYTGSRKISRMRPRSAIVGFSVDNVYAIAELLRRQKGGAAVVMGALSPRTRNAQVEMYQNGDVDYLVATDAIGMGLNLDIDHIAFSSTRKFDGRRMRDLMPNELAQIAGRAGRYRTDGTYGVTGEARPLDEEVADAISEHRFAPIRTLQWRNAALSFGTTEALIASLEARPDHQRLVRGREADDLIALKSLAAQPEIAAACSDATAVKLLWDVCRIPDFRGISAGEHAGLLDRIFGFLREWGRVPDDWLARQVKRIDRTQGDIDTLSKRLAYIRTWTYVAQRKGWVDDAQHWREATRAVEDRLSDALHEALTQRFVDRRTSVLLRRLKQKEAMLAEVNDKGEVSVEGQYVGRLEGFRFRQDKAGSPDEAKTLRQASIAALTPHFNLRADRFYNAPDTEIDFTEQGGLMWGTEAVGKLVRGDDPLRPRIEAFVDEEAGPDVAQKVERRLQHFIDRKIAALFEPLTNLKGDETLEGLAKGFAYRLIEAMGVIPRDEVAGEVKDLDQTARGALRKHGVRFGQFTIFLPLLLKPAPTRLRLLLWSLYENHDTFPESPPPGLVTIPVVEGLPDGTYLRAGYRPAGDRAIRIDMLERLADMLRAQNSRAGFEATPDMLSITGMTLEQFAALMTGLGYKAERGERAKVAAPKETPAEAPSDVDMASEDVAQPVEEAAASAEPEVVADEPAAEASPDAEVTSESDETPEMEVFYTFTWAGRARNAGRKPDDRQGQGQRPRGKGKPKGGQKGKGGARPQTASARPPRKEKAIDPDNPFAAALMGLKDKG